MMIHAYDEMYVFWAQRVMGDMFDFAVNTCCMEPDEYMAYFLNSSVAKQIEHGNPAYITGKTGCELVRIVMEEAGMAQTEEEDAMYLDKSPEYWAGWALAFYQWYTGKTFARIVGAVKMEEICGMYPTLHEADIMKFAEVMDSRLAAHYQETNLKRWRKRLGFSQRELAENAQVTLRQIQLYEQRQRDINKAQAITLYALSRVLGCTIYDLMEI